MQGSKTVYIETSSLKSNTKLKMNKIVKKGKRQLKMKEKVAKMKKKENRKRIRLRQKIDKNTIKNYSGGI